MDIKSDFHQMIDEIDDNELLESYYNIIQRLRSNNLDVTSNYLIYEQEKELTLAYEESFDEDNLISHEEMKKKYLKWLNPLDEKKVWNYLGAGKTDVDIDQLNLRDFANQ